MLFITIKLLIVLYKFNYFLSIYRLCLQSISLQYVAISSLGIIAARSSNQMPTFVEAGVIPKLINLLKLIPLRQCIAAISAWTLGNIAANGTHMREEIFKQNIAKTIIDISSLSKV